MNVFSKTLLTVFAIGLMSFSVSAQRGDKKDPPPKPKDSPVVRPGDKPKSPPPRDKDKDKDKDKPNRPEMSFLLVIEHRQTDAA
ncbi:hypothetical protein BH24ACI3_BH24ACI3_11030 [soil metagenome]